MAEKKRGAQSVLLQNRPRVLSFASMAGPKEAEGPLAGTFDETFEDDTLGEKSWERGEAKMLEHTVDLALSKARVFADAVDAFLGGDLLNQIVSASYTARQLGAAKAELCSPAPSGNSFVALDRSIPRDTVWNIAFD